jgi:methionyl-tRNA synthetase
MKEFINTVLNTGQYRDFLGDYGWLIILALIWSLIWKGMALWKAARNSQRNWFIALLLINTLGILDIIYLLMFRKPRLNS